MLRRHSEHGTLAKLIPWFDGRDGWFVFVRTALLVGLNFFALSCPGVAVFFATYFILDALRVNTTYAFVTCHTLYFWQFKTPPKTYRGPF